MNFSSYEPIDVNKYGIHTFNYLLKQAKKNKVDIKNIQKKINRKNLQNKYSYYDHNSDYISLSGSQRVNSNINNNFNDVTQSVNMARSGSGGLSSTKFNSMSRYNISNDLPQGENEKSNIDINNNYVNNQGCISNNNFERDNSSNFCLFNNNNSNNLSSEQRNNIFLQNNDNNKLNNVNYGNNNFNNVEEKANNENERNDIKDNRLTYTMIRLGLEPLINFFNNKNIGFVDLLFLSKEDMDELNFQTFQKVRLLSFIKEFGQIAENYTLEEIDIFFNSNPKYSSYMNEEYYSNSNMLDNNENNLSEK